MFLLLGVVFVVPLDLAITPMRVLEDPTLGPKCRAMFDEGDVDDRLLMMLFLAVERVRKNSSWKPYVFINFFCFVLFDGVIIFFFHKFVVVIV